MSDSVELAKTGVELVEKYADKLGEVIAQYSGPAADLALAVGRVAALREVVVGLGLAVLAGVSIKGTMWFAKKAREGYATETAKRISEQRDAVMIVPSMCAVACCVPSIIFTVTAFNSLTDIFAWIGVFHPEVYLAAKALGL